MSISRSVSEHPAGRVLIGRVVGAHGIKGAVRVHPLTDYPERFLEMDRLYLERAPKPPKILEVERVSSHEGKGQFLFSLRGVESRDAAEALTGCLVTVAPEERVSLPEGEYWIDSLIGLEVRGRIASEEESETPQLENLEDLSQLDVLGKIEDVMPTGSNDVYLVRTPDGAAKLIPAIADVVRRIDLEAGVMIVALPEGLWD